MAKLGEPFIVNSARLIAEAIDRARRDAVQRRNAAKGEVLEAYYEGARQALADVQAFAEKVEKV